MAPTKFSKPKHGKGSSKPKTQALKTRKQMRKDQRKQKKAIKAMYYQKKTRKDSGKTEIPTNSSHNSKKLPLNKKTPDTKIVENHEKEESDRLREMEERRKLEVRKTKEIQRKRITQLTDANSKEDKEIKKLEKKLKLNKRKSKSTPQSFVRDGLDYILDFCDKEDRSRILETEKQMLDADMGAEFDEDFNMIMGINKEKCKMLNKRKYEDSESDFDSESETSKDNTDNVIVKKRKKDLVPEIGCSKESHKIMRKYTKNVRDSASSIRMSKEKNIVKHETNKMEVMNTPGKFVKINSQEQDLYLQSESDMNEESTSDKEENDDLSAEDSEYNEKFDSIKSYKNSENNESGSSNVGKFVRIKKPADENKIEEDSFDEDCDHSSENSEDDNCNNNKTNKMDVGKFVKIKNLKTISTSRCESTEDYIIEGSDVENDDIFEDSEEDSLHKNETNKKIVLKKKPSEKRTVDSDSEYKSEEGEEELENDHDENHEHTFDDEQESDIIKDDEQSDKGSNHNKNDELVSKYFEDIYGRRRDKHGNIMQSVVTYIPPAARASNSQNEDLRLRRQLKGLVNRLAEHNMHTISAQIEDLYMSNSRNAMNEIFASLMLEALVAPILSADRMIAEHMMLVAILHANVGIEVGAHFLLTVVRRIDDGLNHDQSVDNKEIDNMILILAHLYNFKIYGHKLLYQILEKLAHKFTEKEIELILLVLRSVGFPLRKDDPTALKELILNLQQKASAVTSDSSRVKFMLDVLLAIKNNNMSKIPQYDPSHVEHLKKLMKSFLRKGNSVTQFNISLEDLLHANERGKWWVVGSAWSGTEIDKKQVASNKDLMFSQQMLELARKQRMNTDVRRNIFCIIMSAADYLDAFEKLHRLGLKDQQERELIYVLLDCCLQEKNFNPYYAVLAQKLCEYDRRFQLTIQYTLWDKLKTLDTFSDQQLSNLARFLTSLFIEKSIAFSVLKVIQFAELDKRTMRLLRQIILGILLHENAEICADVFERISVSPKLQQFREGLRLFIGHFLMKNVEASEVLSGKSELLRKRTEMVDKILVSRANKTVF